MKILRGLQLYSKLLVAVFQPRFWSVHICAIVLTIVLIRSGVDWVYFLYVMPTAPSGILFTADLLGFVLPIVVPICLLVIGWGRRHVFLIELGCACGMAVVLGSTISTFIKAFTGRTSPPYITPDLVPYLTDSSAAFHFGFLREQIIGGWPSSHATIACALATTLILLLPRRWYVRVSLVLLAAFISFGVTLGFHWLSEGVAGMLLGTVIGFVVGDYYKNRLVY